MSGKRIFRLSKLHQSIANKLKEVSGQFWVKVEISSLSFRHGHLYLEVIEKDKKQIIAKQQVTVWSQTLKVLQRRLGDTFNSVIRQGSLITIEVDLHFHSVYGMSLNVLDLDESHTIGELEKLRRIAIQKLIDNNLIQKQKDLNLPIVLQNIAVISSSKAAGYEDFIEQISQNQFGYSINIQLFDSEVQGIHATKTIIHQLKNIDHSLFDVICIIRGGGAKTDLLAFDTFEIGEAIAHCPIPVITGIGHERDETISDLVAYRVEKTPTSAGQFIISRNFEYEQAVNFNYDSINKLINNKVKFEIKNLELTTSKTQLKFNTFISNTIRTIEKFDFRLETNFLTLIKNRINSLDKSYQSIQETSISILRRNHINTDHQLNLLKRGFDAIVEKNKQELVHLEIRKQEFKYPFQNKENELKNVAEKLKNSFQSKIQKALHSLELLDIHIETNNPEMILNKGYTMTLHNGKLLTEGEVKEGEMIETVGKGFKIESIVNKID
ncbi:exodeoxyribonuclease VII large subunit [Flammeovirga pacifica]|uniref:Exodeoxyribonuclease 7 large subunit n=1 Tax=Flammeovirga pacifica TaxID=915059 RepID=A0A1S1YX79_FLAPC|nr:exodeoxyribonuclease VII large subunit [Flammeovirga pacifica]OHX65621.1 exodeoxyribonuclease VII large subunit [Flammeovirga pacifica]